MKPRALFSTLLIVVCLAMLWRVWSQRSQLASLRAEREQRAAQLAARTEQAGSSVTAETATGAPVTPPVTPAASPELLRLRNEVTRLTERRRELEDVRGDNETLRAQLAGRGTNDWAGSKPPPGYIRKSEAQMVGFNTPEDTLQTLLWAIRNHDVTNLLQAFTSDRAEDFQSHIAAARAANEDPFREAAALPGLRVVGRKQANSGGFLELEVEMVPDLDRHIVRFQQTNGQWRIAGPL